MNFSLPLVEQLWPLLGMTMICFLIIGTLLLVIAGFVRLVLKHANPRVRYAASLTTLTLLMLVPIVIARRFTIEHVNYVQHEVPHTPQHADIRMRYVPREDGIFVMEPTSDPLVLSRNLDIVDGNSNWETLATVLSVVIDYLPWLWIVGTPLTFLLLVSGLVGAERLRKSCQILNDGPIRIACDELRTALGVGREVGIALCESIATPLLVGVVKPLILLPSAAITGWSPEHLEMVLVHELAHVRRWDNAVNLAQRIVESLLFFHPAVWIVSGWVRRDREDCCDAVVVAHTAKPQAYAELLVALASHQPLAGLAASAFARHPLGSRIRRILKLEDEPMLVSRKGLMLCASAIVTSALLCFAISSSEAEDAPGTVSREAERVEDERSTSIKITKHSKDTKSDLNAEDTESTEEKSGETYNSMFPTLEDQQAADFAYKLLGVELEKLTPEELGRVNAKGYAGGLRIVRAAPDRLQGLGEGDLLVGLHVWPTESFEHVNEILHRFDLNELAPLKFYVVRRQGMGGFGMESAAASSPVASPQDELITGRISVDLQTWAEKEGFKQERLKNSRSDSKIKTKLTSVPQNPKLVEIDVRMAKKNLEFAEIQYQQGMENIKHIPGSITKIEIDRLNLARQTAALELERKQAELDALNNKPVAVPDEVESSSGTLLYDGKTFEQWRSLWKTELKTEKRIECINALAAFGHAGRGDEAGDAILDAAGEYDFSMTPEYPEEDSVKKLKENIMEVLTVYGTHLPVRHWLPALQERLIKDPAGYKAFTSQVLMRLVISDVIAKPILSALEKYEDQSIRQAALSAILHSQTIYTEDEKHELVQAILTDDPITAIRALDQRLLDHISVERCVDFLLNKDSNIQLATRQALSSFFDNEKGQSLTEQLLNVLNDETRQKDHVAVIRALASLRSMARKAADPLSILIRSTVSEDIMLATIYALDMVTSEPRSARTSPGSTAQAFIPKQERWSKYYRDGRLLKQALLEEATKVMGDQTPFGGMGGGGISGGGMF